MDNTKNNTDRLSYQIRFMPKTVDYGLIAKAAELTEELTRPVPKDVRIFNLSPKDIGEVLFGDIEKNDVLDEVIKIFHSHLKSYAFMNGITPRKSVGFPKVSLDDNFYVEIHIAILASCNFCGCNDFESCTDSEYPCFWIAHGVCSSCFFKKYPDAREQIENRVGVPESPSIIVPDSSIIHP